MAKMNNTSPLSFINMMKRNSNKAVIGDFISSLLIFSYSM